MSTHAKGTFEVKKWDESPYNEVEGAAKVTRASVEQRGPRALTLGSHEPIKPRGAW